jgi:threonine dehydrogenase-like Zn-dependent dehydrogenase
VAESPALHRAVRTIDRLHAAGEVGGRTVRIDEHGEVGWVELAPTPLPDGHVRVRTVASAISPGTEMTFLGKDASNVYLRKTWNPELRLFQDGSPGLDYPIVFGYRAAGAVVDAGTTSVPLGTRVYGSWRHTELVAMPAERATAQRVPDELSWDDAVDVGQMGPICVNAALHGAEASRRRPAVVVGSGPIGLTTAQVVRAQGAASVTVVDRLEERLEIARRLGFETMLAADDIDVAAALKERHGADGIPVAWECSGSVPGLAEAIRIVARLGTVVAVGFYQGGAAALMLGDEFHHNAVRVLSAQIGNPIGSLDRAALQARTIELARARALKLGELPRLTLPVEEVSAAFEALRRPREVFQVALQY